MFALRALDAEPASAVYVGDSPFDLRAAHGAGVIAAAAMWGDIFPREQLLAEQPDLVFESPGRRGGGGVSDEQRSAELRDRIDEANHRYHVLDQPSIDDGEYDALLRELLKLEAEHPELVTPDSPTQRVGAPPSTQFATVAHPQPMLSLANAKNEDEFLAWGERMVRRLGEA